MSARKRILVLFFLVFLAGCGGSGGSSAHHGAPLSKSPSLAETKTVPVAPAPTVKTTPSAPSTPKLLALLPAPHIIKAFIPFGTERKEEMRRYSLLHYGINSYHLVHPHLIVEHYTVTPNFSSTYNVFAPDIPDSQYHELPNTCAHFVVDTNGDTYQIVPLDIMCRSVVGLNYTAIAIENVGFSDHEILDNPRQMRASLELTRWLRCRYNIPIPNVIGHNESLSSPYYRELVASFRGQTHEDWNRADMNVYRKRLQSLPCR